jgi:hypothetical protein
VNNDNLANKNGDIRDNNGRFAKGCVANPHGRPKNPEMEELRQAIRAARKTHGGRSILKHFADRAYVNDGVLIALMKKLLPDKSGPLVKVLNQINNNGNVLDKEMQQKLRAKLRELIPL